MGEINVVPYIDVMLVLLIIFMVTAPLLTQGIEVELPKAGAEPIDPAENADPLVLSVDQDGNLYLNVGDEESTPLDAKRIIRMTSVVLERSPATPVLVKADFRVPYGDVVAAMVLLQRAGAEKIGFLTDPAELKKLEAS
ncbi:MAG: protein TolR [Chromatiales bacterium]|jgi:biopolymer transport protein TolR|nr:protein TolR [Chromatiales bacterium]